MLRESSSVDRPAYGHEELWRSVAGCLMRNSLQKISLWLCISFPWEKNKYVAFIGSALGSPEVLSGEQDLYGLCGVLSVFGAWRFILSFGDRRTNIRSSINLVLQIKTKPTISSSFPFILVWIIASSQTISFHFLSNFMFSKLNEKTSIKN